MLSSVKQILDSNARFDLIFWQYSSYVAPMNEMLGFDVYALISCATIVHLLLAFICISIN